MQSPLTPLFQRGGFQRWSTGVRYSTANNMADQASSFEKGGLQRWLAGIKYLITKHTANQTSPFEKGGLRGIRFSSLKFDVLVT
jgi:hypothetical protein